MRGYLRQIGKVLMAAAAAMFIWWGLSIAGVAPRPGLELAQAEGGALSWARVLLAILLSPITPLAAGWLLMGVGEAKRQDTPIDVTAAEYLTELRQRNKRGQ